MFLTYMTQNFIIGISTLLSGIAFFICAAILLFNYFQKKKK